MPKHRSPGVYIEEIESGAKPIEGVATSTAGFLGPTERGPLEPRLITSFEEFKKLFGGYLSDSYLTYAVEGFFCNGGKRCYVARIAAEDAVTAEAVIGPMTIQAIGPGIWGNRIAIKITKGSMENNEDSPWERAKLTVLYWEEVPPTPLVDPTDPDNYDEKDRREPTSVEVYDDLVLDGQSSDFLENKINGLSQYIRVKWNEVDTTFDVQDFVLLGTRGTAGAQGGAIARTDYKGRKDADPLIGNGSRIQIKTGLEGLAAVDEISILCAPDENDIAKLHEDLIAQCEDLKDRFAILQAAKSDIDPGAIARPGDSRYAAFYSPWIKILDPATNTHKLIPPGGHIAGVYARTDTERGVHKAPANEVLFGVVDLQIEITKGQQDVLNPKGINCIRVFPGLGIRVWGARTISSDPQWKYISVRRLFIYVEESIEEGIQWAVFEPHDESLWARVKRSISQFLFRVWIDGALMGGNPEEAFFVKCDRTTMTQDDINNGRLVALIGIAPVKPAEFMIFRIAQWAGGFEISE
jgi:phage tail sheath protein FI